MKTSVVSEYSVTNLKRVIISVLPGSIGLQIYRYGVNNEVKEKLESEVDGQPYAFSCLEGIRRFESACVGLFFEGISLLPISVPVINYFLGTNSDYPLHGILIPPIVGICFRGLLNVDYGNNNDSIGKEINRLELIIEDQKRKSI